MTKPPSRAKASEIRRNWNALLDTEERMGQVLLELLAHPDATPEQIAAMRPSFIKLRAMLRRDYARINEALGSHSWPELRKPEWMKPRPKT